MDKNRYSRNILLDGFGEQGQRRLLESKVLVVGAGGLGSPVLFYLAAAGVGTLGIVDGDRVDISNLQRQILHSSDDMGRAKVLSAKEKLMALNPDVNIVIHEGILNEGNAAELIRDYDFVIDCSDNYATKFLINDVCVALRKPYSHGAVSGLRGEVMTCVPGSADYRKVFDSPPAELESEHKGILGSVAGIVGSIQATEALKYLTGMGKLITDRILIVDGAAMTFHSMKVG